MGERGGTTVVRRPERPRSSAAREAAPERRAEQRPERRPERQERTAEEARPSGRFDLSAWVFGMVDRADDTPAEPFRQGLVRREAAAPPPRRPAPVDPAPRALRRPAPDPTAPALRRPEPTPPALRRPEPTPVATRRPEGRGQFDLAAWVFGLVPAKEPDQPDAPAASTPRRTAWPPARKPLTMPDLFEGAPVPPCLDDD